MTKKDMTLLIEVEDELSDMDKVLEQLTGYGYANGEFTKLDNVFDVICNNSHPIYPNLPINYTQALANRPRKPA